MNIARVYRCLNTQLMRIIESATILEPVPDIQYSLSTIRLENNPVSLAENAVRSTGVITAHNINQYKNKVFSIKLEEDDKDNWFKILINYGSI